MCTYLKNMEGKKLKDLKNKSFDSIQKMFDRAFKRVNTFVDFRTDLVEGSSKRAGEELEHESTKKQKVDEDKDTPELQILMEVILDKEEVAIDAVPLATKSPKIVDWKIHKEGKKSYYQIVRADGKSQMYMIFSQMLKSFDREDLEDLYKLVKARYGSTRPVESMDYLLWNDLKTMFEPHVEDAIWRNQQGYKVLEWKLYDSCGVHSLMMQHVYIYMLVEKRYPLTPPTITDMLNKKLQCCSETWKKNLLVVLTARYKSYTVSNKVNAAIGVNAASEEVSTAELADLHDHIREFLAIYNVFRYGETQSEVVKLLIFPFSLCDKAKTWFNKLNEETINIVGTNEEEKAFIINKFFPPSLFNHLLLEIRSLSQSLNEELQDMREKYNELRNGNASKNNMNDDTPMCERHEANYIQSEGHQNRNSHDSHSHQSHHDRNDSEKSLTELNNDVRNNLEDFKRCIRSMRTVHWKLFARDGW
ncbi:hypothetical protein Tco_1320080 [Tanacetum coccineum]